MRVIVSLFGQDLCRLVDYSIAVNHSSVCIHRVSDQFTQIFPLIFIAFGYSFYRIISFYVCIIKEVLLCLNHCRLEIVNLFTEHFLLKA